MEVLVGKSSKIMRIFQQISPWQKVMSQVGVPQILFGSIPKKKLVNPQIDGTLLYIYAHNYIYIYIYTWLDGMFKNWHVIFSDWLLQDKRSLDLAVGAWKRLAWPRGRLAVHPSSWSLGKIPMVQGTASPFCWHIYMSSQYMDMYIYIYVIYICDIWYMKQRCFLRTWPCQASGRPHPSGLHAAKTLQPDEGGDLQFLKAQRKMFVHV